MSSGVTGDSEGKTFPEGNRVNAEVCRQAWNVPIYCRKFSLLFLFCPFILEHFHFLGVYPFDVEFPIYGTFFSNLHRF